MTSSDYFFYFIFPWENSSVVNVLIEIFVSGLCFHRPEKKNLKYTRSCNKKNEGHNNFTAAVWWALLLWLRYLRGFLQKIRNFRSVLLLRVGTADNENGDI